MRGRDGAAFRGVNVHGPPYASRTPPATVPIASSAKDACHGHL